MDIVLTCPVCHHNTDEGGRLYRVREMMFGTREVFPYVECAGCGCLWLADIPRDMARHYPPDYYAFAPRRLSYDSTLASFLKRTRTRWYLGEKNIIGFFAGKVFGAPFWSGWLAGRSMSRDADILDVGSGTGDMLLAFRREGFTHLTGVDPFIEKDIAYENGVKVFRSELASLPGQFDFIMMHHAFEHVANPLETLKAIRSHLRLGGIALIRIPVVSQAWKTYGVNWVQLDAPRHIFLHTEDSMNILAHDAGMVVKKVVYDSSAFQFWGSEQYQRDIPLMDERSYGKNPAASIFSRSQIDAWSRAARELNERKAGDQACFFLERRQ